MKAAPSETTTAALTVAAHGPEVYTRLDGEHHVTASPHPERPVAAIAVWKGRSEVSRCKLTRRRVDAKTKAGMEQPIRWTDRVSKDADVALCTFFAQRA